MTLRFMRRAGRATLAVAALALAGCSADPPLSPAVPPSAPTSALRDEAWQPAGGESRASIYVIGSGRSQQEEE
jgi:outer membrane biogenesis lipoprotein LolB